MWESSNHKLYIFCKACVTTIKLLKKTEKVVNASTMSTSYMIEMPDRNVAMDQLDSGNTVLNTANAGKTLEKDETELEMNREAYLDLRFVREFILRNFRLRVSERFTTAKVNQNFIL